MEDLGEDSRIIWKRVLRKRIEGRGPDWCDSGYIQLRDTVDTLLNLRVVTFGELFD